MIAGSAPTYSAVYDPSTNHATGSGTVDANGNLLVYEGGGTVTYDSRNRMAGVVGLYQYSYDPGNKRVWRGVWTSGTLATDEVTFWSVSGQKLATYQLNVTQNVNPPTMYASQTGTNYYFGTKLIKNAGGYIGADRLGSIGHFYPYGQEKPSATQNGTEKFTGYFRDAETGLDYADQRYHNPGTGRFLTSDPYAATSSNPTDASDPGSWNHYAYVGGDPVNRKDPNGQDYCDVWSDIGCEFGGGGYGLVGVQGPDPNLGIYLGIAIAAELAPILGGDGSGTSDCPADSTTFAYYICFHQSGKDWNSFTASLSKLDKRLDKDPECEKFLTAHGYTMAQINGYLTDPATMFTLANLIAGFSPPGVLAGTTNDNTGQTPIIINSSAYQATDQYEQFLTVLHELGHYTGVLAGDHGPQAGTTSGDNDALVIANCSKTLGRKP